MLRKLFLRAGLSQKHVEKLTLYVLIGTIVGLRLGHCLFYDPKYYLSNPLEILKIWEGGLASHGAAIGILISIYLFARKFKMSYLWVLDRIVIVALVVAPFIRIGNLMNSEIIGDNTGASHAFLFVNGVDQKFADRYPEHIEKTIFKKAHKDTIVENIIYTELELDIYFKRRTVPQDEIKSFVYRALVDKVEDKAKLKENVKFFTPRPEITIRSRSGYHIASMKIYAIPRHPSQLYESLAYVGMLIILLLYYNKQDGKIREGALFGSFLIMLFTFRFLVEFLKEVQEDFEKDLYFNMGQLLSIPFIILGIVIVVRSRIKNKIN